MNLQTDTHARDITVEFLLAYIFGDTQKRKRPPSTVTEFKVIETFAGKKELKEALSDLLCSAYAKETRRFSRQKPRKFSK